ncbi:Hypothetical protein A7982_00791 [Minicystis rosea]|nr:Hypothetical protein A7982_00791 [Minicystis rosea]
MPFGRARSPRLGARYERYRRLAPRAMTDDYHPLPLPLRSVRSPR